MCVTTNGFIDFGKISSPSSATGSVKYSSPAQSEGDGICGCKPKQEYHEASQPVKGRFTEFVFLGGLVEKEKHL